MRQALLSVTWFNFGAHPSESLWIYPRIAKNSAPTVSASSVMGDMRHLRLLLMGKVPFTWAPGARFILAVTPVTSLDRFNP